MVVMGDDYVTKDYMFYVCDFIIDELAQSSYLATDVKGRVRCILRSPTCFIPGHLYFGTTLCASIAAVHVCHAFGLRSRRHRWQRAGSTSSR